MEMVKDVEAGNYVGDNNIQKQKRARLKEILTEHAMMTTIHGVAHIVVAKQTYKKILWITLWLLTFGALCYQIVELTSLFLSRPKQTSLDLKFGALSFPAVSFCNINPLKKMHFDELSIPLKKYMKLSEVELKEITKQDQSRTVDINNPDFSFLRKFEKYGIDKEEWHIAKNIPDNHFQVRNMLVSEYINEMKALVDNFLKLDLYFEELSYEQIGEVPAYDSVQFLSDIGGTVGLFVGASVLSGAELIQILVECIRYFMLRIVNK